jgi:6-phosphogluconolactonase (cycloisomerase 2 family)
VGAIDGETISPANIDVSGSINGADTSAAAAGEALTSDGGGSLQFASVGGSSVVKNGSAIAYVALDESNLPVATGSNEVALLTASNQYVEDAGPPLGTPFDITDFVSFSTSINSQDQSPRGIAFNDDGTRLYEIGTGSGINDGTIYQSDLSEPYDITTASFLSSRGAADGITQGIAWNNDGSRMYEVGHASDEGIYQYNVSTPFDISTASPINFQLNVPDSDPNGIAWNDNGTRLYVAASGNDKIYEYNVSSPFSISSANLSTSINTQSGPADVMWNNDGSRLYELGGGKIYQYTVATPYDITTASFSAGDSINTQDNATGGMAWNDDGTQLYEASRSTDKINQSAITGGGWQEL